MMESRISVVCEGGIASIELSGRVDAVNAPTLASELQKLVGQVINKVVFLVKDLEYISSAGLRAIIFVKQKIGEESGVYLINAQEPVLDVIKMSGLDTFLIIQDNIPE